MAARIANSSSDAVMGWGIDSGPVGARSVVVRAPSPLLQVGGVWPVLRRRTAAAPKQTQGTLERPPLLPRWSVGASGAGAASQARRCGLASSLASDPYSGLPMGVIDAVSAATSLRMSSGSGIRPLSAR